MSRILRRSFYIIFAAALFFSGIVIGAYGAGGASLISSTLSPDGKERLDFYNANRWQMLRFPNGDMPGFVRLVRLAGDETLGTSAAFELSGSGQAFWDKDRVQIGTSAVFDRKTGKWDVDEY